MNTKTNNHYDVIIIGAGAAGLMAAGVAGNRGRRVLVLDSAEKIAEKIRISGGGRCNFTNLHTTPSNYISENPHFCKSALAGFTQQDFIAMVRRYGIGFHEKTLGQLFCDVSAQKIIDMLLSECKSGGVTIKNATAVKTVKRFSSVIPAFERGSGEADRMPVQAGHDGDFIFSVRTEECDFTADKLVIATGGLSIPKIGASDFAYRIAGQFGLKVIEPRPGLVPLTFAPELLKLTVPIAGVSVDAVVSCGKASFREGLLFTHRGISGPSILQISSYRKDGDAITINLVPDRDVFEMLKIMRKETPRMEIHNALSQIVPKRLAGMIVQLTGIVGTLADLSNKKLETLGQAMNAWEVTPTGTEGYKTAEVTLGGVDTDELSSKTMECKNVPGLYFVGEAIDVTGHLGGFNFQWAWSSGFAAGNSV